MIVEKLSISVIIGYFIAYLVIHVGIGYLQKKVKEELLENPSNAELITKEKWITRLFEWFPALYIIIILVTL